MAKVDSVILDDDVEEDLRKLAERSGRPLSVVANAALREYVRAETKTIASIERGLADLDAGRVYSTEEVRAFLHEQRRLRAER